jgi:methyl-accepting chemotaxis protein
VDSADTQSVHIKDAAHAISEVSGVMSKVAQNANQAAEGARTAAQSADIGEEKVKLTVKGMQKIKESSAQSIHKIQDLGARSAEIGKIVSVIDEIASQTNLLALNAAIEAARAGEQGRGFAVVSDEVRKLAERTATATKEISELIGGVQISVQETTQVLMAGSSDVTEGYNRALEAGKALEDILKVVSEVNTQVNQISSSSTNVYSTTEKLVKVVNNCAKSIENNTSTTNDMSLAAREVSRTVENVAGIAEEYGASTEQVSASAQEMSAQAQELVASSKTLKEMSIILEESVAFFKIQ